ncbi:hypothetical protein PF005_g14625 [Phytophthora fragariae]|uniref:Uncharacterized protein n=1 Tax=Phytophthora fragariae TaxID=53985 RepID=A0A6A3XGI0_9STRA|nr:hypothetical protein PF003_g14785 [Phytophthora fragariae]KAE8934046.1 hypothetical protein PF009_g15966 [Phytophthora fragariae]KAE8997213.1 hypothetical protein PF011_g15582 [Phytophthora fragariae]KAE9100713.1 hypothetical protein PF007_g15404 [Phytophthora fragariae]KAE9100981.1 hypothetical protein PF010_g14610 [Phytophthora fragariae]
MRSSWASRSSASEGRASSKRRQIDTSDVITYLESRFGSSKKRDREQHAQERARLFTELEKLVSSLKTTKAAGMSAALVRRLELKVEMYMQRVEDLDDE